MRAIQYLTAQAGPGKKKNTCDGVAIDWLWPGQLGYYLVSSYDAQALLCLGPFIMTQSQIFSFVALPCSQKYPIIIQTNSNQGVYCV